MLFWLLIFISCLSNIENTLGTGSSDTFASLQQLAVQAQAASELEPLACWPGACSPHCPVRPLL